MGDRIRKTISFFTLRNSFKIKYLADRVLVLKMLLMLK